jgi:ABC-type enterobactin transport system permease subunit
VIGSLIRARILLGIFSAIPSGRALSLSGACFERLNLESLAVSIRND